MDNLATLDTDRQRVKRHTQEWYEQDDQQSQVETIEPENQDTRIAKILDVILRVLCG